MTKAQGWGPVIATGLTLAGTALAWKNEVLVSVKVHGHRFDEISVEGNECNASAVLSFDAPAAGYDDPMPVRNAYNFKAKVRFASGKTMLSPQFKNTKAGRQQIRFEVDSTKDGCWTKQGQSVIKVQVEGCRGAGCTPASPE